MQKAEQEIPDPKAKGGLIQTELGGDEINKPKDDESISEDNTEDEKEARVNDKTRTRKGIMKKRGSIGTVAFTS